jgi:hypothetical protein
MIEAWTNVEWILLDSDDRAERFMKFSPVETVSMLEETPTHWRSDFTDFSERLRLWKKLRAPYRHLFQKKTKSKKLRWAKSWAKVEALKDRLIEVEKARVAKQAQGSEIDL